MGLHTFIIITFLVVKAINLVCKTSLGFSGIKVTQTVKHSYNIFT